MRARAALLSGIRGCVRRNSVLRDEDSQVKARLASVDSIAAQAKPDEVNPDRALGRADED